MTGAEDRPVGRDELGDAAEYCRLLNDLVRERLGGLHSTDLVIVSVDFAGIERLQVESRWDEAGLVLAEHDRRLESSGAELVMLCTNTMHKVAGAIETAMPFPHLGNATTPAARCDISRRSHRVT